MTESNQILKWFDDPLVNADSITRWNSIRMIERELLSTHIVEVIGFSLVFGTRLQKLGVNVDLKEVVFKSAVHDLGEVVTVDMPSHLKTPEIRKLLNAMEKNELDRHFDSQFVQQVMDAKDPTIEGVVVTFADAMSTLRKTHRELRIQGRESKVLQCFRNALNHVVEILQNRCSILSDGNAAVSELLQQLLADLKYLESLWSR